MVYYVCSIVDNFEVDRLQKLKHVIWAFAYLQSLRVEFQLNLGCPAVSWFGVNFFLSVENSHELVDLIMMDHKLENLFVFFWAHALEVRNYQIYNALGSSQFKLRLRLFNTR